MRTRTGLAGATLLILLVCAPARAGADTITMTSGSSTDAAFTSGNTCGGSFDCSPGALVRLFAHGTDTDLEDVTFDEPFDMPAGRNAVMITAPSLFSGAVGYPRGTMVALTNLMRRDNARASLAAPPFGSPGSSPMTPPRLGSSPGMATPEPASMMLLGLGLAGAAVVRRRRGQ